jgi:hypothetical protein
VALNKKSPTLACEAFAGRRYKDGKLFCFIAAVPLVGCAVFLQLRGSFCGFLVGFVPHIQRAIGFYRRCVFYACFGGTTCAGSTAFFGVVCAEPAMLKRSRINAAKIVFFIVSFFM